MKVKVFQSNHNGKIEFTRAELEKLLNEVYNDGYNEGKSSHWTWTSPSISTTPYYASSISGTSTNGTTINSTKCEADKITGIMDNSIATSATSAASIVDHKSNEITKNNPSYTVKVNGTDISELVNELFGGIYPKSAEDVFDNLAKELNF